MLFFFSGGFEAGVGFGMVYGEGGEGAREGLGRFRARVSRDLVRRSFLPWKRSPLSLKWVCLFWGTPRKWLVSFWHPFKTNQKGYPTKKKNKIRTQMGSIHVHLFREALSLLVLLHSFDSQALPYLVAFCSPAKSLTSSGLMENPLVCKKLKS